jgi:hypothetical protein
MELRKFIATTIREYLNEMALPSPTHTNTFWYHGTSKEYINKIIQDKALKPSESVTKRSRGMMTPMFDKVYLAAKIDEAIGYAYFRSSANTPVYLVIVDGNALKDIQPDEDVIADLLQTEDTIKGFEWLDRLAKYTDPKLYNKFQKMGDYAYSVSLAKKVVNRLSDAQKIELINKGLKIAHSGIIKISQIWELPPVEKRRDENIINGDNYQELGKRIY